jgi:hypothetical protein
MISFIDNLYLANVQLKIVAISKQRNRDIIQLYVTKASSFY